MSLILFIPLFVIVIFLALYVPGKVILGEQKNLSGLGSFVVSFILGIVLWGWQGYIFGFLQLRWLSYIYLLVFLAIFISKKYFYLKIPRVQFKKIDIITALIVVIGVLGQVMPFVKTGLISSGGLFVSSYNFCDHIWHAALAQELATKFPPNEPGLFGIPLANYNFWFHLVAGEISRVFHLPLFSVQFSGLYPLASILLAIVGYIFAVSLYNSRLFTRIFLFFLFFSGDAIGWLFSILNHRLILNISQGFDDSIKFMDTPGYGFSVIIALAALYIFFKNKQHLSKINILIIGMLVGSLIGFKTYIGIPFLLGFGILSIFGLIKRNYSYLWLIIIAAIFSAAQFLPFNANSGGLFFLPFETPRSFIAQGGLHLGWIDQRWSIYWHHHNYLRLLEYGVIVTAIYLLVQFGVKLIGFFPLKRTRAILGTDFLILLYSILISSLILSLFFYQKVGGGNIWQFFLPVSLMLTIFASLNLFVIFSKINTAMITAIIIFMIFIILPSWFNFVVSVLRSDYLSSSHGIPVSEITFYDYLKNSSPKDSTLLIIGEPSYNCFIASPAKALSERNLFFSGTGVSGIIFPEYLRREKNVTFIKSNLNDAKVNDALKKDKINYVVIFNSTPIATNSPLLKNKFLDKVFSNESTKIFKVN